MLDRASARKGSRYIGSGEAASYRRLPPLEPITALSWHVPLPVLRGPLSEPSVIDYRRLRTFCPLQSFRLPASSGWGRTKYLPHPCVLAWLGFRGQDVSGEIGLPRVGDARVCEDVHERGLAACEGSFQGGLKVGRAFDEFAVAAQRLDDLVVAEARLEVGCDRVPVEELHRVLLERPDAVVAHHADNRDSVADHRVELQAREAEGAVPEEQADLAVGAGELRGDRVAGAGAEAAVGARVHPAAGFVGVDHPARVGDEVAPVADHDRVAVEYLLQLVVDAHRVKGRAIVGELGVLGC